MEASRIASFCSLSSLASLSSEGERDADSSSCDGALAPKQDSRGGLFSMRHSSALGIRGRRHLEGKAYTVDDDIADVGLAIDELTVDDEPTPAGVTSLDGVPANPYNSFLRVSDDCPLPSSPGLGQASSADDGDVTAAGPYSIMSSLGFGQGPATSSWVSFLGAAFSGSFSSRAGSEASPTNAEATAVTATATSATTTAELLTLDGGGPTAMISPGQNADRACYRSARVAKYSEAGSTAGDDFASSSSSSSSSSSDAATKPTKRCRDESAAPESPLSRSTPESGKRQRQLSTSPRAIRTLVDGLLGVFLRCGLDDEHQSAVMPREMPAIRSWPRRIDQLARAEQHGALTGGAGRLRSSQSSHCMLVTG